MGVEERENAPFVSDDILIHLLSFLSQYDLCAIRLVNKRFNNLALKDYLWMKICQHLFCENIGKPEVYPTWYNYFKYLNNYRYDLLVCSRALNISDFAVQSFSSQTWSNVRLAKTLLPGRVYKWKHTILETVHSSDSWYMIFGVETPDFPWEAKTNSDVVGFTINKGYGFLPVIGMKLHTNYKISSLQTLAPYNWQ